MTEPHGTKDFFISYRGPQSAWARWVNWIVRDAGFTTVPMDEFEVGTAWTSCMRKAAEDCCRLIPLYSDDYWKSGACEEEFDAYWRQHMQNGSARFLLPLEVEPCNVPKMHRPLLALRLVTLPRDEAQQKILAVLSGITPVALQPVANAEPEPRYPGVSAVTAAANNAPVVALPSSPITVNRKGFVNCDHAFIIAEQMLTAAPSTRILLVHGHGNEGKSTLLNMVYLHCRDLLGPPYTARVEFKKAGDTPEDHLLALANALKTPVPSTGNIDQRLDAVLDALQDQPVVLFFDAYEHAEVPHRHWLNHILDRCLDDEHLRCLVAGRDLPPSGSQPWGHLAITAECDALKDKTSLIAHAKAKGYTGPIEQIEGMITLFIRLRERAIRSGQHDHDISSRVFLEELEDLCCGGGDTL